MPAQRTEEENSVLRPICKSWLVFGDQCANWRRNRICNQRHTLIKMDIPTLPYCQQSHIRYSIKKVHSPVNFEVHILAYRSTEKREWKDETFKLLQRFERSYSANRTKRQFNHQFEIGQFGVVNYDGKPRRVQIVNIISEGTAKVKFLDIPGELACEGADIQYLMEEYRDQNDIALYIGGVVPCEGNWHSTLTTHVRNILMGENDGGQYRFESRVLLHLNGLIMVDDVIRTNESNEKYSLKFSVKKMLIAKDTQNDRTALDNLLECYSKLGKLPITLFYYYLFIYFDFILC